VEKFLPQLVYTSPDGYKSVSYEKLTPILTEAIKEQQHQIESFEIENNNLKSQLQTLQDKVDKIETLLAKALDE
jgi:FtsZ-binding cell division protein ZapB